jgi:predicted transglutaminase-like cysteine proteinase
MVEKSGFQQNAEKKRQLSKRQMVRKSFFATIAALPMFSADVKAESRAPVPGGSIQMQSGATKNKQASQEPQLKKGPERAHRPQRLPLPSPEDADFIGDYLALTQKMDGTHLQQRGQANILKHFEKFCNDLTLFCETLANHHTDVPYHTAFTPELYARIASVQREVNEKIKPMTDLELNGVMEKWWLPDAAGDCEDYVLLKIVRLIGAGIGQAQLHILVVHDENNQGHAVLGVDVFDNGSWNTLVLDNRRTDIITLSEMEKEYRGLFASFVNRQHKGRPRVHFFPYASGKR